MKGRILFNQGAIDEFNAHWQKGYSPEESQGRYRGMPKRKKMRSLEADRSVATAVDWHQQYAALWPPDLVAALWSPTSAPHEPDLLIQFLVEDPYFFRSGYAKEIAAKRLLRIDLSSKQLKAIADLCLDRLNGETRREYRSICRLARLPNSVDFIKQLRIALDDQSLRIRLHALWMTEAHGGHGNHGHAVLSGRGDGTTRLDAAKAYLNECIAGSI
ncbi:MAG: hypothetical protein K1X67_02030 [Fimbriimonadaceae bacterium]|nr:hypothetical protein [Fimbriimonadaceae bacterium]